MPLTKKGKKIKKSFKEQYGKDADKVFYASANKGTLKGVIKKSKAFIRSVMYISVTPPIGRGNLGGAVLREDTISSHLV